MSFSTNCGIPSTPSLQWPKMWVPHPQWQKKGVELGWGVDFGVRMTHPRQNPQIFAHPVAEHLVAGGFQHQHGPLHGEVACRLPHGANSDPSRTCQFTSTTQQMAPVQHVSVEWCWIPTEGLKNPHVCWLDMGCPEMGRRGKQKQPHSSHGIPYFGKAPNPAQRLTSCLPLFGSKPFFLRASL